MLGLILFAPVSSVADLWGGARGRQPPPSAPRPPFCVAPWPYFKLKIANFSCASGANLQNCNILQGTRKKCTIFSCFLQLFQKLLILGWLCKICSVFLCFVCVQVCGFYAKKSIKVQPPPMTDLWIRPCIIDRQCETLRTCVRVIHCAILFLLIQ